MSDSEFLQTSIFFKDPELTSADRDSACIRDRVIFGLCRCIWSIIFSLCVGPQHIIDQ